MHKPTRPGMRLLMTAIALSITAAACGDSGAPATTTTPATAPTTSEPAVATTQQAIADVEITTADGLTLEATEYPGGATWVVLAHMRPADKDSWASLASLFQDAGYSVLAYNNRGYGDSEGEREAFQLLTDASAALGHARSRGATGLVFGGASMNGAAAMALAAAEDFAAVFALSAVPAFPSVLDAAASLPSVAEPILFVAAGDDGSAVADADAFSAAAPDSHRITLEAGGHGTDMLNAEPGLGEQIVAWVTERLATSD